MKTIEEDLIHRLPSPLAQLYHSVRRPRKTPLEKFLAACQLWEAAVKLLAAVAIAEYQRLNLSDPAIQERLRNLARPALGHWWEFVRLLVPVLARSGDKRFQEINQLLFQAKFADCPHTAALEQALRQEKEGRPLELRTTVRLQELFDLLVWLRNREMGHGALGQRKRAFYAELGQKLLPAIVEILDRLDVLAGRRLLYVAAVSREASGRWSVERFELTGEAGRLLDLFFWTGTDASCLPCPGRIYLDHCATVADRDELPAVSLHPLVVYDAEEQEVLFLNQRRGRGPIEYLCYGSGRTAERPELATDQQELLAGLIGTPVAGERLAEWARKAEEEGLQQETQEKPQSDAEDVAAAPANPQRVRIGDFELLSILGKGGMGIVYRARQTSLGRQVALKNLYPEGNRDRFAREIRALGQVKHPNLVEIFTSGSDGQQWFYAMELVEGATLAAIMARVAANRSRAGALNLQTWEESVRAACEKSRLAEQTLSDAGSVASPGKSTYVPSRTHSSEKTGKRDDPASSTSKEQIKTAEPSVSQAPSSTTGKSRWDAQTGAHYMNPVVELIRQVGLAAHALHDKGVIHRDIKPGNIMVTPDGAHAVLMDLGLAKLVDGSLGDPTMTRQFVGTVRYASPEQVHSSKHIDCRTDVYSLGATLWELLTFQAMHGASEEMSRREVENRILVNDAEPVGKYNRRVPMELQAIVAKCLERDPKDRYKTALALAEDLQRFLAGEPVQARRVGTLRRTFRQARRHPVLAVSALAVPLLLVAAVFAYRYWDAHFGTHVEYYSRFVMRWGAPVGSHALSDQERGQRAMSWKFTMHGPHVAKIEALNGHGFPTTKHGSSAFLRREDEATREVAYQYKRNEQGEVIEENALDRQGHVVWTFHYSTKDSGYYANARGIPQGRSGTGAAYVEFVHNDQGYDEEIHYLDKEGKPQRDELRTFGMRRKFDEKGLMTELQYLDESGNLMVNKNGIAKVDSTYNQEGYKLEATYFDLAAKPVLSRDGYAGWKNKYDPHGNLVEIVYLDQHGSPTLCRSGYAKAIIDRDEHGDPVQYAFFDDEAKPVLQADGCARWKFRYDSFGNQTELENIGLSGKATIDKNGYAKRNAKYDDQGNEIEASYFDTRGKPTFLKYGYARWTAAYDAAGNKIEQAYFGTDGKPALHKDGNAKVRYQYDQYRQKTMVAYFDTDDKPIRPKVYGYAKQTYKIDNRGNVIETTDYDEDGALTLAKDGYAIARMAYDDQGNRTEAAYFGVDNVPIFSKSGFAKWTAKYDAHGQRLEEAFFGVDGKPTTHKDGNARAAFRYDTRGNTIENAYYGLDGKPVLIRPGGYAKWTSTFNSLGHEVEVDYWGVSGKLIQNQDGYAQWKLKYDDRGNRIESTYFGPAGTPVLIHQGFVAGKKCGYHKETKQYDDRGNTVAVAYFGLDGKPALSQEGIAKFTAVFDQRSNRVEVAVFGVDGKPTSARAGYSKWTARYDERDNEIDYDVWGPDGRPFFLKDGKQGYAKRTARFNELGQLLARAYFGVDGKPARQSAGNSNVTQEFDAKGRLVANSFWGYDGRDGYYRSDAKYNEQGKVYELAYFDEAGKPALHNDGYAKRTSQYNNRGQEVERAFFDTDGKAVLIKDGYAKYTAQYNERGQKTAVACFDTAGKSIASKSLGFSNYTRVYDTAGKRVAASFWGFDGRDGFFRFDAKYNDRGEILDMAYFDKAGKPAMHRDGYARWTATYPSQDYAQPVVVTYFDVAGQIIANKVANKPLGLPKELVLQDGTAKVDDKLTIYHAADAYRAESHCQAYTVKLQAGAVYQIDMESRDLDSFLRLEDSTGSLLAEDDDGGDGLNARLAFTCSQTGTYRILATTFESSVHVEDPAKIETGSASPIINA